MARRAGWAKVRHTDLRFIGESVGTVRNTGGRDGECSRGDVPVGGRFRLAEQIAAVKRRLLKGAADRNASIIRIGAVGKRRVGTVSRFDGSAGRLNFYSGCAAGINDRNQL